jgi:DNA-binding transcriptional LysR family regulator
MGRHELDIYLFRDLERLRATGNFSQAAALSHLGQPAFSRRIKALEAWVGATLVDRSRQPVRLTSAGDGVAWLPRSLVQPDLDNGILVRTGDPRRIVDLSILLIRDKQHTNRVTRAIWSYLEVRQSVSLMPAG